MTIDEYVQYANKCSLIAAEGEESNASAQVLAVARQSATVDEAKAALRCELERADLAPLTRHVSTLAIQRDEPATRFGHERDGMPRGNRGKRRSRLAPCRFDVSGCSSLREGRSASCSSHHRKGKPCLQQPTTSSRMRITSFRRVSGGRTPMLRRIESHACQPLRLPVWRRRMPTCGLCPTRCMTYQSALPCA